MVDVLMDADVPRVHKGAATVGPPHVAVRSSCQSCRRVQSFAARNHLALVYRASLCHFKPCRAGCRETLVSNARHGNTCTSMRNGHLWARRQATASGATGVKVITRYRWCTMTISIAYAYVQTRGFANARLLHVRHTRGCTRVGPGALTFARRRPHTATGTRDNQLDDCTSATRSGATYP